MYIQENSVEKEHGVPPDYSGHTYVSEPPPFTHETQTDADESAENRDGAETQETQKSTPAGAFFGHGNASSAQKSGKRGDFLGGAGLGGLFSRIPFLSSLAPPPRSCGEDGRAHGDLWDWILLAVIALSILNGKDDDVLPLLLLLLLWD